MSSVELATRECRKCGVVKPLSDWHPSKRGTPAAWCRECTNQASRESRDRLRAEIGDEAFRRRHRLQVDRHRRKTGNAKGRRYGRIRNRALSMLVDLHRDEFVHLMALAEKEIGE